MIVTWEQLDACETPDAIAALLRQYGVRGVRGDARYCPLARATGWRVDQKHAFINDDTTRRLTPAQREFVELLDHKGRYPDLIEED